MTNELISKEDATYAVINTEPYWAVQGEGMPTGESFVRVSDVTEAIAKIPYADRPTGEVNAVEIYEQAVGELDHNKLTLGEFEKRIEPLKHLYYDRPTGWIPVSEKLPIPPTFCLVTTDGSRGDVIDIALYMSDGWHKASEVLAWMPLPEPYKGGDAE